MIFSENKLAIVDFAMRIGEDKAMRIKDTGLILHRWPYGLEVQTSRNGLLLRPRQKARASWAKAFRRPLRPADGLMAARNFANEFDRNDWKW